MKSPCTTNGDAASSDILARRLRNDRGLRRNGVMASSSEEDEETSCMASTLSLISSVVSSSRLWPPASSVARAPTAFAIPLPPLRRDRRCLELNTVRILVGVILAPWRNPRMPPSFVTLFATAFPATVGEPASELLCEA